jgi:hypothetical protein
MLALGAALIVAAFYASRYGYRWRRGFEQYEFEHRTPSGVEFSNDESSRRHYRRKRMAFLIEFAGAGTLGLAGLVCVLIGLFA